VGLRFWQQDSPHGRVTVVVGDRGLRAIGLPGADLSELLVGAQPERDAAVARALDDLFAGRRTAVDVPLDLDGIAGFRRTVLETLAREVGWGETVSYGELAAMAGRPGAARAVGTIMASNPLPFVIPCHRVIAAGGRIGGYGGGREAVGIKRALLAREGVTVR
jgi:methylated-DNA-[protein]-cysteine S-methyltransferase